MLVARAGHAQDRFTITSRSAKIARPSATTARVLRTKQPTLAEMIPVS